MKAFKKHWGDYLRRDSNKKDLETPSTKTNKKNINHYVLETEKVSQTISFKSLRSQTAEGVPGRTFLQPQKEVMTKSGLEQWTPGSQLSSFYHFTGCEQICCTMICLLETLPILVDYSLPFQFYRHSKKRSRHCRQALCHTHHRTHRIQQSGLQMQAAQQLFIDKVVFFESRKWHENLKKETTCTLGWIFMKKVNFISINLIDLPGGDK